MNHKVRSSVLLLLLSIFVGAASAQTCANVPYTLTNGTTADASQVMANFNHLQNCINSQPAAAVLRGWLAGLTMSNNVTTPNTYIDVSAGVANSDDATTIMTLAAFSKNTGSWSVNSGSGCLDSGSVAADTWYHLFVIARLDTGVVDVLCSTSATAPVLPTNYTKKRRIGAFKTNGASQIYGFKQLGDEFLWVNPKNDLNTNSLGTTPTTISLASVPGGVQVNALIRGWLLNGSSQIAGYIIPNGDATTTVNSPTGNFALVTPNASGTAVAFSFNVRTSSNQEVKAFANAASSTLVIATYGWIDTRGRFD